MYKKSATYFVIVITGFLYAILPHKVLAAELTFKLLPEKDTDGTSIVEVRINPQSKNLNVVEGTINFQGDISDKSAVEILTSESVLTIWPVPPKYFPEEKVLRFSGGVPNGFDEESLLFRIRLPSSLSGELMIFWTGGAAYLNDGKGTKDIIYAKPFTINFDQNDQNIINKSEPNNIFRYDVIIITLFIFILLFAFWYGYKKINKK